LQDVLSGQVQDISGIASGITSAEFQAAALRTGGTTVNNYYEVQVQPGNRMQQNQTVETLRQFANQNGGDILVWTNS